ncbi:MAG TPA: hypothetical protein VG710_02150 [Opitutus sp.]|nr:hypothetical protein [Opitutus sp.]
MRWRTLTLSGPPPPRDLEFAPAEAAGKLAEVGLPVGRCFGSKSRYRERHRRAIFLPNANVFSLRRRKLWWGDLDLRVDRRALEAAARRLRERLYVLSEMDGRFGRAELPVSEIKLRAIWHTGGKTIAVARKQLGCSGLSAGQIALLLRVRPGHLTRRQPPEVALEVRRRFTVLEDAFGSVGSRLGLPKWGHWWLKPHSLLDGRSPFDQLAAGEEVDLIKLLGPELARPCWLIGLLLWKRIR